MAPACSRRAVLLSALAAAGPLRAQPPAAGIELAELMRALMLPKGARQLPGWNAFDTLPVHWKTAGPVPAAKQDAGLGLPQQREGQFVLLAGGKPAYTRDAGGAGRWDIALLGAGQGVAELRLSMAEMAQSFASADAGLEDLKKSGFALQRVCVSPTAMVFNTNSVWRLGLPDRLVATVKHEISSGRLGASISLTLPYSQTRVSRTQCE